MKKLSIIIPYHNEPEELITPMFDSLNNQREVDWNDVEIIVTNDHKEPVDLTEFINKFSMISEVTRYILCPTHFGPGPNRQYAVDNSNGKYIMYLDADDILVGVYGIRDCLNAMSTDKDIYTMDEFVEMYKDGELIIATSAPNRLTIHGMLFKRSFVKANGVRFDPDVRVFEDSLYLKSLMKCTHSEEYGTIPIFYKYRHIPTSISRAEGNGLIPEVSRADIDWFLVTVKLLQFIQNNKNIPFNEGINFYVNVIISRYRNRNSGLWSISEEFVEMQASYLMNRVDPTLVVALQASIDTVGGEPYPDWVKRVSKKYSPKEIENKLKVSAPHLKSYIME